jgi:hypothetical protein
MQLGAVRFERSNGGTRPTLVGVKFLEGARKFLDDSMSTVEFHMIAYHVTGSLIQAMAIMDRRATGRIEVLNANRN